MKEIKKSFFIIFILLVCSLLFAPPQNVRVKVDSNPQGALVKVKGLRNPIGYTPVISQFTLGEKYILTFTKEGYKEKTIVYQCDGSPIFVNLEPEIVFYRLTINSNINGADVFINNNRVGKTPYTGAYPAGVYNIGIKHPGFKDYNITINLTAEQTIYANLEPFFGININLPRGSQLYINGEKQNLFWDKHEEWKSFYFTSNRELNSIRVRYHGIEIEKNIKFDNRQISLILDIN